MSGRADLQRRPAIRRAGNNRNRFADRTRQHRRISNLLEANVRPDRSLGSPDLKEQTGEIDSFQEAVAGRIAAPVGIAAKLNAHSGTASARKVTSSRRSGGANWPSGFS